MKKEAGTRVLVYYTSTGEILKHEIISILSGPEICTCYQANAGQICGWLVLFNTLLVIKQGILALKYRKLLLIYAFLSFWLVSQNLI